MTLHKALVLGLCCALIDLLGARLLDSVGVVEGLLAPSGAQLLLLVPVVCAFYGARLIAHFALPALVVAALVLAPRRATCRSQASGSDAPSGLRAAASSAK